MRDFNSNEVILVDKYDQPVGTMEKLEAHRQGLLHRAFSIFIFDQQERMLLQQRADNKYHSGGLWSNACCSHPIPGEDLETTLQNKLEQEMGFTCPLEKAFSEIYKAPMPNGLVEHEFDHVFFGFFSGKISPNPAEVKAYRFLSRREIEREIAQNPDDFTAWFKILYFKLYPFLELRTRA